MNVEHIINNLFLKHPRENNMTYIEHCCFSTSLGLTFFVGSIQAFCHGCIPALFETSSTDISRYVLESIQSR